MAFKLFHNRLKMTVNHLTLFAWRGGVSLLLILRGLCDRPEQQGMPEVTLCQFLGSDCKAISLAVSWNH